MGVTIPEDHHEKDASLPERVEKILQDSDYKIDPVSYKALKALYSSSNAKKPLPGAGEPALTVSGSDNSDNAPITPARETTAPFISSPSRIQMKHEAILSAGTANSNDDLSMMELLKNQTQLLLQMQQDIYDLQEEIKELKSLDLNSQKSSNLEGKKVTFRAEERENDTVERPANPLPEDAQQPRPPNFDQSRFVRLLRLFIALRRHYVPNLDLGLVFKIAFMVALMFSRLTRRKRDTNKFYVVVVLAVIGYLYQTKILSFLYRFAKEGYPYRILIENEEIDPAQEVAALAAAANEAPPGPQARQNNEAEAGEPELPHLQDTFLGGRIHRPPQNVVFRVVSDVFMLFGSFFLSIFPMWRPEPFQPPPQVPHPEGVQEEEAVQPAALEEDTFQDLPEVNPPVDVLQAVEDSDDDENEEATQE